jgi:hypothetical protein
MQFNQAIVDEICERISLGASLTRLLLANPGKFPSYQTFCRWRREFPHVEKQLAEARENRTEFLRDRFADIIDGVDEENVQSSRLKMDGLKYLMSVENRGQYGEKKTDVNITVPTQIVIATGIDRDPRPVQTGDRDVQIEGVSSAARVAGPIEGVSPDRRENFGEVFADPSTAEQSREDVDW